MQFLLMTIQLHIWCQETASKMLGRSGGTKPGSRAEKSPNPFDALTHPHPDWIGHEMHGLSLNIFSDSLRPRTTKTFMKIRVKFT